MNSPISPKRFLSFSISTALFCSLCACNNPQQVVFKSSGVTQTFTQGKSATPKELEDFVYPGATTSGSVSAEGNDDEQSKFLMLSSKSPLDAVNKWYQDKMKEDGWKTTNLQEQSKLISITGEKDKSELNIMITEDNGMTNISLSVAQQLEGNYGEETNHEGDMPNKIAPPTD